MEDILLAFQQIFFFLKEDPIYLLFTLICVIALGLVLLYTKSRVLQNQKKVFYFLGVISSLILVKYFDVFLHIINYKEVCFLFIISTILIFYLMLKKDTTYAYKAYNLCAYFGMIYFYFYTMESLYIEGTNTNAFLFLNQTFLVLWILSLILIKFGTWIVIRLGKHPDYSHMTVKVSIPEEVFDNRIPTFTQKTSFLYEGNELTINS